MNSFFIEMKKATPQYRRRFFYKNTLSLPFKTSSNMTKNLDRVKIKAFLKTLKEQYPEQFAPALKEFMEETQPSEIDALLEQIIDEDFAEYDEVFKALA
jgi:hypothetical protein